MVLTNLHLIGGVVSFIIGTWTRRKFEIGWTYLLFFFAAMIAGIVVYLVLGIIWASWDPETSKATAHAVGAGIWGTLGDTLVGTFVGLFTPLGDNFFRRRQKALSKDSNGTTEG